MRGVVTYNFLIRSLQLTALFDIGRVADGLNEFGTESRSSAGGDGEFAKEGVDHIGVDVRRHDGFGLAGSGTGGANHIQIIALAG